MSLRSPLFSLIPDRTVEVAQAAFPKGNPYMRMRDTLGPISTNPEFAALFPKTGQPAHAPAHLALITIMQFAENLSDAQAADAVRSRIDWKYALALDLTDPGFDASILSEFRTRLIDGNAELLLFESMLILFRDQGLLKARGRQRTDSTHVLAAIQSLNRLECVGETLRHALNTLATVAPDWLQAWVPSMWFDRYGRRFENYRLPPGKPERYRLAEEIGADGVLLLHTLDEPDTPAWLRDVPAVQVLRRVWTQQFTPADSEGHVRWHTAEQLPPAPELISSPYDPDARYSRKRDTEWVGYKVHVTESCDDEMPHLLTNIETTPATTADGAMTTTIQDHLAARNLSPGEHIVDTAYVSGDHLVASQAQGIDLVGPVATNNSWQARVEDGMDAAEFVVDWKKEEAYCPQGKRSVKWKEGRATAGHEVVVIAFAHADCRDCVVRGRCGRSGRPRSLTIRQQTVYEALQAARERLQTEAFRAQYAVRSGIEGTLSQGVRRSELRRSRYVGEAKTRLMQLVIGAALNFVRVAAWLADVPHARTRRSAFARLAAA